jgi:hypothetical protein
MSNDVIVVQPVTNSVTVTPDVTNVQVASPGPQGAKGDAGTNGTNGTNGSAATIAVGTTTTLAAGSSATVNNSGTSSAATFNFGIPQGIKGADGTNGTNGTSGVIAVNAPITNAGTSSSANLSVSAGSTSAAGVLQLTDSTSSTSTTTAATPNSVKTAYDTGAAKFQFLPFRSSSYYSNINATASTAATVNRTIYNPIYIPNAITIDRLQIITINTFAGTAVVRLGIYNDNGGVPSTVLVDGGTVSCTAAATAYTVTISQAVSAGWYWLAFNMQTAATTPNFYGITDTIAVTNNLYPRVAAGGNGLPAYSQDSVTGAFATAGTLADSQKSFRVAVRVA